MMVPPEITFRGVTKTESIEALIREKIARLERYSDHINSCRIAVENRHQHQRSGQPFRVRLDIKVPPGHDVIVTKDSSGGSLHDELHVILNDAFDAAARQLKKITAIQRGESKRHPRQETAALVSSLFPGEGYGFIRDLDGREIYFHKNSVLHGDFDRLAVGTGVRFVEAQGEEGPQASTVQIVDKPGVGEHGEK